MSRTWVGFILMDIDAKQPLIFNQSWQENRSVCQSWGADLAVHEVQTMKSTR